MSLIPHSSSISPFLFSFCFLFLPLFFFGCPLLSDRFALLSLRGRLPSDMELGVFLCANASADAFMTAPPCLGQ